MLGFLNIDKPLGVTSHDVVAHVRRGLKIKKVGHAGTLDPLATGVLVICVGAATRLSEYVMHTTKQYRAQVHLGIETETYDAEGSVIAECDASAVPREAVEQALLSFVGDIDQTPPMYSAIKQGGRKLYELARAGETVERPARAVRIDNLTLVDWSPPRFTIDVTCSAGTYIRSLAHDLGEVLGVGAHLSGLIRTASGAFGLENATALDTLLSSDDWQQYLITPRMALAQLPSLTLDQAAVDHILHGRTIPVEQAPDAELVQAYDPQGVFIAVLKRSGSHWRPHKVFHP
ncbi:MAG: tRNA pseudouridine(55) synthase TruB [Anaerolineae bacterium]|nr:tRNA pseudouridine(55) synthase TruB [Anaerolineae bacterium]